MKSKIKLRLVCWLADGRAAEWYNTDDLDESDKQRVQASPALAQRLDWQVSRAIKQHLTLPILSLSHSGGGAAVLGGQMGLQAGVDLECLRPRDYAALVKWVASAAEQEALARMGWCLEDFYTLWTLKEALLKAANLVFPADMPRVGWQWGDDGQVGLHVDGQLGWHGITAKIDERWLLSCVWHGEAEISLQDMVGFTNIEMLRFW